MVHLSNEIPFWINILEGKRIVNEKIFGRLLTLSRNRAEISK